MFSFLFRVIPALISKSFPVVVRLVVLLLVFRAVRFLLKQWRGLGKR